MTVTLTGLPRTEQQDEVPYPEARDLIRRLKDAYECETTSALADALVGANVGWRPASMNTLHKYAKGTQRPGWKHRDILERALALKRGEGGAASLAELSTPEARQWMGRLRAELMAGLRALDELEARLPGDARDAF